jgi:hypothetical protein
VTWLRADTDPASIGDLGPEQRRQAKRFPMWTALTVVVGYVLIVVF